MGRLSNIPIEELNNRIDGLSISNGSIENWAKTFVATPQRIFQPNTIEDVEYIIEAAFRQQIRVKPVGVWHSPSDLSCSDEWMIRMHKLAGVINVDTTSRQITVYSGTLLREINEKLEENNLAMPILGSISDQTIAGCLATATHGSGIQYRSMSSYVRSLSLLLSNGDILECSNTSHSDLFNATLCSLGATGVILTITLSVDEKFNLHEIVMPLSFDDYMSSEAEWLERWYTAPFVKALWVPQANGISLFQSYKSFSDVFSTGNTLGGFLFSLVLQPLLLVKKYIPMIAPLISNLAWRYLFGSYSQRVDKSFNVFNMDCGLLQYTTEWSVPLSKGYKCLLELNEWLKYENDVDFPLEIRVAKSDDIFLSPANKITPYGQESHYLWIGVIKYKPYNCKVRYRKTFRKFEDILRKYNGRAHWAKHSTQTPQEVGEKYPLLNKYLDVIKTYDEEGMFINPFVERHLISEKNDNNSRDFKSYQVESHGF
ncbi:L-gulonolactone/D-arabinono-1,4-lactone oxidase [Wallemia mellicola]|uniref:D-arabinono-1,4-lactone oxidase n=1 Tax=Wallemia mellicola TaxID=1708541 RepID=A0A4T0MJV6_9BASI|nr:L-gulonolactone/D-arabinono-1,4-lactone oxidase [Wallemia mellicola]TIB86731.1 L-gulonolactone/D-arabinono-1,4-lactone oxidase [Wallemia mellicola]TIB99670.1 L-gulonolactone/D-arabinono-1,4-lactone oxidase [Wallemia mellicola]TIC39692.1 L-gulonolactone/D-arabinono-1,4-lactone oxidase [Wallemia mellicola]TIC47967.1 L-gulonolactone/D-arabinono-1,4-lactone oxidase [Wallemia mellicola]